MLPPRRDGDILVAAGFCNRLPAGYTALQRAGLRRPIPIIYWNDAEHSGHFAAFEQAGHFCQGNEFRVSKIKGA
jgi:hypothetical protein